jgi:hypothetical protein
MRDYLKEIETVHKQWAGSFISPTRAMVLIGAILLNMNRERRGTDMKLVDTRTGEILMSSDSVVLITTGSYGEGDKKS